MRFLICTDVGARGLDIVGLPYVLNMTREGAMWDLRQPRLAPLQP